MASSVDVSSPAPPRLRTATLRLTYRVQGCLLLSSPPASVCRGQLGAFLKRIAPESAHSQELSLYKRLFRTPRSTIDLPDLPGRTLGALGLAGKHVPHPFVMRMRSPALPGEPLRRDDGETIAVELILVEDAIQHLPSLAAALEALGDDGLGRKTKQPNGNVRRGRAYLTRAVLDLGPAALSVYEERRWQLPADCTPALFEQADGFHDQLQTPESARSSSTSTEPIRIHFRTPLRLKHRGSIVQPDQLTVSALASNLFRRVMGLAVCYGSPVEENAPDTGSTASTEAPSVFTGASINAVQDAFIRLGDATTLDASDTRWTTDSRYSHRQRRRHPTSGLVGSALLQGPDEVLRAWQRWLRVAEPVHLGKKTSMGLGRIEIAPPGPPSPSPTQ